ncbi:uncharacterized protein J5M81_016717 [Pluvialis apricaria]
MFSEYADDNALIPKNPSVIVRSVPSGGVKATSKPSVISGTWASEWNIKSKYADDNALIPKNPSVIVRSVPSGGVKATSKPSVISGTGPVSGTSKANTQMTMP